jgi:hypothetical protein
MESLAGAGVAVIDVGGTGEVARVAQSARDLGLYTIALLDNDQGPGAQPNRAVRDAARHADVALWLPPNSQLEWLLIDNVPDQELRNSLRALEQAIPDIDLPANWTTLRASEIDQLMATILHDTSGSVHSAYIESLDPQYLPAAAITALTRVREMAVHRNQTGLVRW